jgi:hypothetical protein
LDDFRELAGIGLYGKVDLEASAGDRNIRAGIDRANQRGSRPDIVGPDNPSDANFLICNLSQIGNFITLSVWYS